MKKCNILYPPFRISLGRAVNEGGAILDVAAVAGQKAEMRQCVAVVDGDADRRAAVVEQLREAGLEAFGIGRAADVRGFMDVRLCGLVLTDLDLPDGNGLTLIRDLRAVSAVGVIVLTERASQVDRIVALEMGADDYLVRPVDARELGVRCRNLLWRVASAAVATAVKTRHQVRFSDWIFDSGKRLLVGPGDTAVTLTRQEAAVLQALVKNPGRVMSRDALMDAVGRGWNPTDRTVDVLIGRLRKKVERDSTHPEYIVTVYGEGYMFADLPY